MAVSQYILLSPTGAVYVNQTGTRQEILPVVYVDEAPVTPPTGDTLMPQAVM